MNAYIIKYFDFESDVPMSKYSFNFDYREVYYSEERLFDYIKYSLLDIHEEYQEITNSTISYDELFTKFNLIIEVGLINLNHRKLITKDDYNKYLEEVKTIPKNELLDYLLSYTDGCSLYYDHNLSLKQTFCTLENFDNNTEMHLQFAFSYKALFNEKYHISKYKDGDRVKYNGEEYIIYKHIPRAESIYDFENPLDYLYGYSLFNDNGYFLQDDKWCYFVVDEDLESLPDIIRSITNKELLCISDYIFEKHHNSYFINNIPENFDKEYTKLVRSDNHLSIILDTNEGDINISHNTDIDLMSYTLFNNDNPIIYIIGYININKDMNINKIIVKYDDIIIDTITVNKQFYEKSTINISKYIE